VDRPLQAGQGEVCNGPLRTLKDREFHEYLCDIQLLKWTFASRHRLYLTVEQNYINPSIAGRILSLK